MRWYWGVIWLSSVTDISCGTHYLSIFSLAWVLGGTLSPAFGNSHCIMFSVTCSLQHYNCIWIISTLPCDLFVCYSHKEHKFSFKGDLSLVSTGGKSYGGRPCHGDAVCVDGDQGRRTVCIEQTRLGSHEVVLRGSCDCHQWLTYYVGLIISP